MKLNIAEGKALINQIAAVAFDNESSAAVSRLCVTTSSRWYATPEEGKACIRRTNGVLITDKVAVKLKESGAMAMGISLDSIDPEKHDQFRATPGAWQGATDGMSACRKAGLPFQIHTTVMDWNMDEVEKLTDFAVDIGAIGHHIFFLVPTGAVDIDVELPRAEQYGCATGL